MAIEEMFTELPTVSNSLMTDIICAVQGYVSPSVLGLSTQQTLAQVFSLFQFNIILSNPGDPNGFVAGSTYQFCWDTVNSTLYICVTSGTVSTAVWIRADINDGFTTTVTAAATTTLTIISTFRQFFTGVTTQMVVMPVASTLAAGMTWKIVNNSSGAVTVQSSGLNTITTINPGGSSDITCILNSGTTAASWYASSMAVIAGFTWNMVTGTSQAMLSSNGYIANNVGLVTLTLPATSNVGDEIDIIGKGSGGWLVQCGGGQTIVLGSSTTSSGGSLASTNAKDSFYMICTAANTEWTVGSAPQSLGLTIA